ncbi:hypothetical protein QLX08_007149 [Tetragonisca angustula]|uniref:Uncharacterized protein n=1 Tax=Tetragonisca angustula TaxID=166442 RepID=A0AAW0ZR06_9HYME
MGETFHHNGQFLDNDETVVLKCCNECCLNECQGVFAGVWCVSGRRDKFVKPDKLHGVKVGDEAEIRQARR